jgi:4-amino-4-deoxy-L-arabinose transferase-like glycosyltransferase
MGTSTHTTTPLSDFTGHHAPAASRWPLPHVLTILALWLAIFVAALASPPLLDDADATHAQAAQAMLNTGDWVTLHVDGIRYLEKPPLPYWLTALSLRLFAPHTPYGSAAAFAVHLPLGLTVLGLALLGYAWSRRAFNNRAALYAALFILTAAGVFLFTRVFIPDALLSLLLAFALYALLRSLETTKDLDATSPVLKTWLQRTIWANRYAYAIWIALALAVLTKGLVTLVFFFATALLYLAFTRQFRLWRHLRPVTGTLLFLAIAAPWHILAGLRNTGGANGHGFFWFYFINEHVLRFLGRRIPRDYNKLPATLYWSLHLVWLFPWSLFAPAALIYAWRKRRSYLSRTALTFRRQTILILLIFSVLVLVFFSVSTNQEYYTFPVYLPLLMLLAAALTSIELHSPDRALSRALTFTYSSLTVLGLAISAALTYGLWSARHLPFVPDIGSLLAHRGVGDYTLSMSHFFDLTGPSFAALRLPATLALLAFTLDIAHRPPSSQSPLPPRPSSSPRISRSFASAPCSPPRTSPQLSRRSRALMPSPPTPKSCSSATRPTAPPSPSTSTATSSSSTGAAPLCSSAAPSPTRPPSFSPPPTSSRDGAPAHANFSSSRSKNATTSIAFSAPAKSSCTKPPGKPSSPTGHSTLIDTTSSQR